MLAFSTPSLAAFKNGNDLMQACTPDENDKVHFLDDAYCLGFIAGAVDDETMMQDLQKRFAFCLRPGVTVGQIKDVVVVLLQQHPEKRDYSAASLIAEAMIGAFPCSNK
jgi:hypothetical protein